MYAGYNANSPRGVRAVLSDASRMSLPPMRSDVHQLQGEHRWPMAVAVIAVILLIALLPSSIRPESRWFLSILGLVLLILVVSEPGRINPPTRRIRVTTRFLLVLLALSAIVTTMLLIHELVAGNDLSKSATRLLLVGNAVWIANNIVFALLYWEFDGGGSAARAHHPRKHPDLAFQQHMNPELAPAGWRPMFSDYLYLGFSNGLAFSPTETMPLVRWAKFTMGIQALISLGILGLVIARAVNILS